MRCCSADELFARPHADPGPKLQHLLALQATHAAAAIQKSPKLQIVLRRKLDGPLVIQQAHHRIEVQRAGDDRKGDGRH